MSLADQYRIEKSKELRGKREDEEIVEMMG